MTAPHPFSVAMLLADARLPGGGHAHSAGLEPALLAGMSPAEVPVWLRGRARTVSLVEAGTAVVTARLLSHSTAGTSAHETLTAVVDAWSARTPSAALREAAHLLGRGYRRVARSLWPQRAPVRALEAWTGPLPRAVALGAIAAAAGLPSQDVVRLTVYEDAQTAAAALLKLEPLDPLAPAQWVLDACAVAEPHVLRVAACLTPEDIPASGAPQNEGWAEAHALLTQRLFRA